MSKSFAVKQNVRKYKIKLRKCFQRNDFSSTVYKVFKCKHKRKSEEINCFQIVFFLFFLIFAYVLRVKFSIDFSGRVSVI